MFTLTQTVFKDYVRTAQ